MKGEVFDEDKAYKVFFVSPMGVLFLIATLITIVYAEEPQLINYQGKAIEIDSKLTMLLERG